MATPRLSKLSSWLEANPAFDVASDWREFVLQNVSKMTSDLDNIGH